MNESLIDHALGLARSELAVLPLLPRTKRPRLPGGYLVATSDVETVTEWWREHPADNIGVRPPRGLVVVDIDPRNGGDVEMRKLVGQHGPLPCTWVVQTGGGGWHYWFALAEMPSVRTHLCAGVDIKHGDNGFVVAPPSLTSYRYRWLVPPVCDPAAAPEWLRHALEPPAAPAALYTPPPTGMGTGYTAQCLVARIAAAPKGSRNSTFFGACRDAARQGDIDTFEPVLVSAALVRGLTATEVAATVQSARRAGAT